MIKFVLVINIDLPKKPTRLKDYDYSQNGYYFITVCTHNKAKIFGNIVGEGSPLPQLSTQGRIVEKTILSLNQKYPHINPEKYVIMPNHIHIIFSVNNDGRGEVSAAASVGASASQRCPLDTRTPPLQSSMQLAG